MPDEIKVTAEGTLSGGLNGRFKMSFFINPHISFPNNTLTDGLISFWKLNEASGTRNDSFGANHLTDNNTVTQAAGIGGVGTAAQFTAANSEYLSIADNAALSVADIDFTITAWVYFDSLGAVRTIAIKADGSNLEYELAYENGGGCFRFRVSSGSGFANLTSVKANTFGAPSTSTWHFVAAWHDSVSNTISISINNGAVDSAAYSAGGYNSAAPFAIGAYAAFSEYFNGRIQNVGFWKKVLTSTERTTLYNGGAGYPPV